MADNPNHRGIHDPWRMHLPDREPDPSLKDQTGIGVPGSEHPMDVDLLPHKEYVFRHPRAQGDLLVYGADDPHGAAEMLTTLLWALPQVQAELGEAGITFMKAEKDPAKRPRGFFIQGKHYVVAVTDAVDVADGLTKLVRALRTSEHREALEKAGVIPLIK